MPIKELIETMTSETFFLSFFEVSQLGALVYYFTPSYIVTFTVGNYVVSVPLCGNLRNEYLCIIMIFLCSRSISRCRTFCVAFFCPDKHKWGKWKVISPSEENYTILCMVVASWSVH